MRIRRVVIENFRGIKHLEWNPTGDFIVLVGPGDSCKTTILEALELVLTTRWNPPISDHDFFESDVSTPFRIQVTVGALPPSMLSDNLFGLDLQGMSAGGEIHDEPLAGDELVLVVQVEADETLEPKWNVINNRLPDGRQISAKSRAMLGMVRLGRDVDRHFTWARGSALAELTAETDQLNQVLAAARREMRSVVDTAKWDSLDQAIEQASAAATRMGAGSVAADLRAAMRIEGGPFRAPGIVLHSGSVPLERAGLATRRLVALGLQQSRVQSGSLNLIDEVEAGLEPYRVRHLVKLLSDFTTSLPQGRSTGPSDAHILITTHSPVVLEAVDATSVFVVRRDASGKTTVRQAEADLQPLLRGTPEAFLARKVIVCEGKTEIGLCDAMAKFWEHTHESQPLAHTGTALCLGQGTQSGSRALQFANLGYPTLVFADSDKPLDKETEELETAGITVVRWSGEMSTETRVFIDMPRTSLQMFLDLAEAEYGPDSIAAQLNNAFETSVKPGFTLAQLFESSTNDETCRRCLADAAMSGGWFKRVDLGQALGAVVADEMLASEASAVAINTDLKLKLEMIGNWAYRAE